MKGPTHLLFAALFAVLYLQNFPAPSFWWKVGFFFMAIIGSNIPDLDHPMRSKIISAFTKHRGIMHAIWIPAAVFIAGIFLVKIKLILFGFALGYFSHLIADALTPAGIRFLHPLKIPKLKGPVKTGGWFEYLIAAGILIYFVSLI